MNLIISSSLNPNSRSRILAQNAQSVFESSGFPNQLIDLAELPLPFCDGHSAYGHENVPVICEAISAANSILIAAPIYNYDVSATIKNVIELSGKNWTGKVVGFLLAAGGQGSYMACMGLANSLMLDFRCLIIPRFVYATGEAFNGNEIAETEIEDRIKELTTQAHQLGQTVANIES